MLKSKTQLIKDRFDYWENCRGAYILSQEYRDELKEFLFTGKSKGLGKYKKHVKLWKKVKKNDSRKMS